MKALLFLAPLPEPVTGQSLACKVFFEAVTKTFCVDVVDMSKRDFRSGLNSLGRVREVLAFIWQAWRRSRSVDCVYFTISESVAGNLKDMLIYLACFDRLPRMAIHLHGGAGMRELLKPSNKLLRALNRFFLQRIGAVIVLGARHVDIFEGIAPAERIHVVPNFAEEALFVDETAIRFKFSKTEPLRLLFLSNLIPGKGYIELLGAYKSLDADTRARVQIDFAGGFQTDAQKAHFLQSIDAIPQVKYHGIVHGASKLELFRQAHLFCLPTYYPYEGQPISILEAYASGCAVMTTDHSGILDVFADGRNGYCVEKRSPDSIRSAIERAVAAPATLCSMALNNRAEAGELYRTDRYNARLLQIIESVAAQCSLKKMPISLKTIHLSHKVCVNCIMDTSDPNIVFDDRGVCDYCNNFESTITPSWHSDKKDSEALQVLADKIRQEGKGKDFDCIIGLSGGLDSSYVAYIAKAKMGLRPLLFHVDAGWNTDQAVGNIEKLVDGLGLDLYTEVINWEEMKDLQLAFLRSQIPDQDLPQDAAFFSSLYKFARKHKIKYVITGSNISTECCREPEEWGGYLGIDKLLFKDIHSRFGKRPLETFPLVDILVSKIYYQRLLGMQVAKPLDMVPFIKKEAEDELERRFGWQRFQHKHHESRFTRFYEDYWLPRKFGFHKRRAHFSSLIMTGQMTREAALARIGKPEMDEHFLQQEFEYVANKLDISVSELQAIFEGKNKTYRDYKNKRWLIGLGTNVLRWLGLEKRLFR